ncbi:MULTISPECIES: hypothetical protein [Chitinophagaceae]|uniref:hypothetical protein n=1 Tax=Chitinophagaceae TaxID=563835 RepID=UPI000DEF02AC|nr:MULTISPECIES: hypothetical protein [Chitinophagaceae]RPD48093.1 hypothetical protein DRJ53_10100 [Paracnuella aquatica]
MNTKDNNERLDGQQNESGSDNYTNPNDQVKNVGSESNANIRRGQSAGMSERPSEGTVGSTHSSGISTKRSVTGSDFDGQVSPS